MSKSLQGRGDNYEQANANGAADVKDIAEEVVKDHSVDAFFFCGDYTLTMENAAESQAAQTALVNSLNSSGVTTGEKVFLQGNHEPAGLGFVKPTGGYVEPEYAYYVLNEDDWSFGGGTASVGRES